eukprot:6618997-Prymnesium_polylepis.1
MLCSKGAAVNQAKENVATPLLVACQEGHMRLAAILCSKGAAINQARDLGETPLFVACMNGHMEVAAT